MKRKSLSRCILIAVALMSLCFMMSPGQSFAGIGGSDTPTVPSIVIVGQTGVDFSFTITNTSTGVNEPNQVRVTNLLFTTACGTTSAVPCAAGFQESGTPPGTPPEPIEITSLNATGELGTACAGRNFTVAKTSNPSEYLFTPIGGPVDLGPVKVETPGVDGDNDGICETGETCQDNTTGAKSCKVNFKVDIKEDPQHDSSANPGLQTSQLTSLTLQDTVTDEFGPVQTGASTLRVASPSFTVEKTGPPLSKVGHTVTYNYSIANLDPDSLDLNLVSVIDNKAGDLTATASLAGCDVLSVGETCTFTKDYEVKASDPDPLVNTVTVIYNVPNIVPTVTINHTDTHTVELFQPGVTITKICDCIEGPDGLCQAGDPVNYTITVTNTSSSDSPNLNCTITDTLLGGPEFPRTLTDFPPGGIDVTTKTIPFPTLPTGVCLSNTASVDCKVVAPWFNPVVDDPKQCDVCPKEEPSGGQEPFKAAVAEDTAIPPFYLSPKVLQFTHADTFYYGNELFTICPEPGEQIPSDCTPFGTCFQCPSKCKERFKSKTSANEDELCDVPPLTTTSCTPLTPSHCTSLTSKGNSGWYEWVIALPKKPEGEMNLEIECAVLKPNETDVLDCAAETGEIVDKNCTRVPGSYLNAAALPRIEVTAHPGGQNYQFRPFHLTAYKNPGNYAITRRPNTGAGHLTDTISLQVLDGSIRSRIALKACMEKTVLIKWPVENEVNALGECEANLEAGDIIKVKMNIPTANTVDIYCGKYSLTIGGIGEPLTFTPDSDMRQIYDGCNLNFFQGP